MKKVTGYRLQALGLCTFLLLATAYNLPPVLAKDATPTASLTPIQQKLENLKQEIASKAAQIKTEISQKISNKAYMGVISQIQDQQSAGGNKIVTITTPKGSRTIIVNDYTTFQDTTTTKKTTLTIKNFSQGEYVAALGDVDDNNVLTAKKLIKTKPQPANKSVATWGQIQSVYVSTIVITDKDTKKVNLDTSVDTDFRLASDEASLKDVKPGNFLISVGTPPSNNRSTSDFIYLLNPNGDLKIEKTASASATPSASPTKKPTNR